MYTHILHMRNVVLRHFFSTHCLPTDNCFDECKCRGSTEHQETDN